MADDIRKSYFAALGLSPDNNGDRPKLESALKLAHEIRKFEIDLYWKRATYFWALEAAVFVAFAAFGREEALVSRWLAVAFAGIGSLTALVAYLSARGSKFWQENWEKHIDLLEDQFEGRLHKTIWIGPKGPQFSVSRLNEKLSFIFFLFWSLLFLLVMVVRLTPLGLKSVSQVFPNLFCVVAALTFCATVGALCWLYSTRTKLESEPYSAFSTARAGFAMRDAGGLHAHLPSMAECDFCHYCGRVLALVRGNSHPRFAGHGNVRTKFAGWLYETPVAIERRRGRFCLD